MGARESSDEQPAMAHTAPGPSLRGLIRWRFGVAGVSLAAAAAVTVWAFYAASDASEFGPLLLFGALLSGVLPVLLLGLLSLAIARGLGRPSRPAVRRGLALDLLILVIGVLAIAIVVALAVFVTGSALHAAEKMERPAPLSSMSVQYAIALLCIGLVVVLVRGSPRTPVPAMKLALGQDLLILIVAGARAIPAVFPGASRASLPVLSMLGGYPPWLWMPLAPAFGAEAAYLLRARWQWRPAWPVFALLAAGLVYTGMIAPAVRRAGLSRQAQPLLDYAARHWVAVPPGARVVIGGQCRATRHSHVIAMQGEGVLCWINAEHVRNGRWTCSKGLELSGAGHAAGAGFGTFFLRSEPIRGVGSAEEARELLRRCGVVDTELSFERTTSEGYRSEYQFWSPLGQGHYWVNDFGHINFYLERPLELP